MNKRGTLTQSQLQSQQKSRKSQLSVNQATQRRAVLYRYTDGRKSTKSLLKKTTDVRPSRGKHASEKVFIQIKKDSSDTSYEESSVTSHGTQGEGELTK